MYIPGYVGKLIINGARCKFRRLRIRGQTRGINGNNSEGIGQPVPTPGFDVEFNGASRVEVDFEDVSFDPAANLFLPPFNVGAGEFIQIQIFPDDIGGVSYLMPSFRVAEVDHTIDCAPEGAQPLSFRGAGNGVWLDPLS